MIPACLIIKGGIRDGFCVGRPSPLFTTSKIGTPVGMRYFVTVLKILVYFGRGKSQTTGKPIEPRYMYLRS